MKQVAAIIIGGFLLGQGANAQTVGKISFVLIMSIAFWYLVIFWDDLAKKQQEKKYKKISPRNRNNGGNKTVSPNQKN